jgi:hypothetical protein
MHLAIVTLILAAIIVLGGMTMAQGFLTSTDISAIGIEEISTREGEIGRTELAIVGVTGLSWANTARFMVENTGHTKLASFSQWDVFVNYFDISVATYSTKWLQYTDGTPGDNEWQKAAIYVNGQPEVFEPGILNPGEEMVIDANLNPSLVISTDADVIIATPNGVRDSISLTVWHPVLTPHSEIPIIAGTQYYRLREATLADGAPMTMTTDVIAEGGTGRWLLHNESDSSRLAKHVYPLTGIEQIPAHVEIVHYRARAMGSWKGDPSLSIGILIRKSDGTIRDTIAPDVANAVITSIGNWQTISAVYNFLQYSVVDDTDYLEVDYYGESSKQGPDASGGYIQLRVDDDSLSEDDQTRIETS